MKQLDADMTLVRREDLLKNHQQLSHDIDVLEQMLRRDNTWLI